MGAVPLVLFAAFSVATEVPRFVDPCMTWGQRGGGILMGGAPPCENRSASTSETKTGASFG